MENDISSMVYIVRMLNLALSRGRFLISDYGDMQNRYKVTLGELIFTIEHTDDGNVTLQVYLGKEKEDDEGYYLESRDLPTADSDGMHTLWFTILQAATRANGHREKAKEIMQFLKEYTLVEGAEAQNSED